MKTKIIDIDAAFDSLKFFYLCKIGAQVDSCNIPFFVQR